MSGSRSNVLTVEDYDRAARAYQQSLPLEHYAESIPCATQRKYTLCSLGLLRSTIPGFHLFNELCVQYLVEGELRQVVPDNMVVLTTEPILANLSFNLELEPARPFWVLEWVWNNAGGKDYQDCFRIYERELMVPYCLMFEPDTMALRMWKHDGQSYRPLALNARGRYEIPELELEAGFNKEWVRFWHRGELLETPRELYEQVKRAEREADEAEKLADEAKARADRAQLARLEAEIARLRALLEKSSQSGRLDP